MTRDPAAGGAEAERKPGTEKREHHKKREREGKSCTGSETEGEREDRQVDDGKEIARAEGHRSLKSGPSKCCISPVSLPVTVKDTLRLSTFYTEVNKKLTPSLTFISDEFAIDCNFK